MPSSSNARFPVPSHWQVSGRVQAHPVNVSRGRLAGIATEAQQFWDADGNNPMGNELTVSWESGLAA